MSETSNTPISRKRALLDGFLDWRAWALGYFAGACLALGWWLA